MNNLEKLIAELCSDGVEYKPLGEIFDLYNGYTPSKANAEFWEEGSIPWFRLEDIRENGHVLGDSLQHISPKAVKGELFPPNSLMISTSATIGEYALLTVPSITNQRFAVLHPKVQYEKSVDARFMLYIGEDISSYCKKNVHQGNFLSVDMVAFRKFKVPLPPLPVQEEIVRILDGMTGLIGELESELAARRKQYEWYRDRILGGTSVGADVLGGPQSDGGWQVVTIEDVCSHICSGGTPLTSHKEYYDGTIPWLRTQEVDWRDITDTELKITQEGLDHSSAKPIKANCVIVAMYGATAGKVAVNKIPLTTNQACCNLEINETKANYRYVFHWLSYRYLDLKSLGQGSQSNINAATVRGYKIPLPPLAEQNRIVEKLDAFDKLCNSATEGLPAEIAARKKQYVYYRNKLLDFSRGGAERRRVS